MQQKIILILISIVLSFISLAQEDTTYVWKKGGVYLRKTGDAEGPVLKTLPFGSKLVVLEDTIVRSPFQLKIKLENYCVNQEPFYLEGKYIKVKSGEDVGYIYDGFTCSIPTPKPGFIAYHEFFKTFYGSPEVASIDDTTNHLNIWYHYKNGYTINYRTDFGGRNVHYTIILTGISANEAFLIVNHFETVRCAKQRANSMIYGISKYFQFSTANENVSEGSAVIMEHRDRVLIEIQQDWE